MRDTSATPFSPPKSPIFSHSQQLIFVGFTLILVGYLSVWLPGPAVGLTFLGLELGEWVKFLGVGWLRDLFYLPPITLGGMLVLYTAGWNGRWQTWLVRGLAVLIGFLAFPAFEDLAGPGYSAYLLRVGLLVGVAGTAVFSSLVPRLNVPAWAVWVGIAVLGVIGGALPTWMYLDIRPYVSQVFGVSVGVGIGVWLNGVGHGLVTAVVLWRIRGK